MGPVNEMKTDGAKWFASLYALSVALLFEHGSRVPHSDCSRFCTSIIWMMKLTGSKKITPNFKFGVIKLSSFYFKLFTSFLSLQTYSPLLSSGTHYHPHDIRCLQVWINNDVDNLPYLLQTLFFTSNSLISRFRQANVQFLSNHL